MVDYPAIFGHEGAGYILEIGSGVKSKDLNVGDAVLLSFNTCSTCKRCKASHPVYRHLCPQVRHNAVRLPDHRTPVSLKSDGRGICS
jgi:Zn-dependent alcohol dehydrogenase